MSRRRQSKSAAWRRRQEKDAHVRAARRDGYRSRAAYKLLEINAAAKILRAGGVVVDLGAAPGGWSQAIVDAVGATGRVVAVDLAAMAAIDGVEFVRGDFRGAEARAAVAGALGEQAADAIVSDMAPNLTGIRSADQARAAELGEAALEFAAEALREGGDMLIKAFEGEERERLARAMAARFAAMKIFRPKATRADSREMYLLGRGFSPPGAEGRRISQNAAAD